MYLKYIRNSYGSIIEDEKPTLKWAKDLDRPFNKEDMQMTNKCYEKTFNISQRN